MSAIKAPDPTLACVRLVLIRHGESTWNLAQRFTGWADVPLTQRGERQMQHAGAALRQAGLRIDVAFSSLLGRCVHSAKTLLEAAGTPDVPIIVDWRLNERHYGALTGHSKAQAIAQYGAEAVQTWRRTYRAEPPPWGAEDNHRMATDPRYAALGLLPSSESLAHTVTRVNDVWRERIEPAVNSHQTVAVVAHGNSLRALAMQLEHLSENDVAQLEISNAEMRCYQIDAGDAFLLRNVWRPAQESPLSDVL